MKNRNGFVSNSSSSSFVVQVEPSKFFVPEEIQSSLSKAKVNKLLKNGFYYSKENNPDKIELNEQTREACYNAQTPWWSMEKPYEDVGEKKNKEWYGVHLGKYVSCNQGDVIDFLIKNKISFIASIHSGDWNIFYKAGEDFYTQIYNPGRRFSLFYWPTEEHKSFDIPKNVIEYVKIKMPKKSPKKKAKRGEPK